MGRHAKKKKSTGLIRALDRAFKLSQEAVNPLVCWKLEQFGVEYSAEEKTELHQAQMLFEQAKKKVSAIYEVKIGKAIVSEIKMGDWR